MISNENVDFSTAIYTTCLTDLTRLITDETKKTEVDVAELFRRWSSNAEVTGSSPALTTKLELFLGRP